jgi:hypothetical protein
MKAVVLFCTVVLAVGPLFGSKGQTAADCAGIVQSVNSRAAAISNASSSYWAHRANFVDLIFGQSRAVPNAKQQADQHKAQGDALRVTIPNTLENFNDFVAMAQAESCLPPVELSAIVEPTVKLAKRVNFDQFPPEVPIESTVVIGPPEMPQH